MSESLIGLASLLLGAVNLGFILKIVFNDLHNLHDLLEKHLDWSSSRHLDIEHRVSKLEKRNT